MEVVEDEEMSELVKKLRAGLASLSGQIEVSKSTQPVEIIDYAC